MKRTFLLNTNNNSVEQFYKNHATYHKGDSGLDLFVIEDLTILPGETKFVDTGLRCQSRSFSFCPFNWIRGQFYNYHSYWLMPRSSISKTPLMLKNSMGLIDSSYLGNIKAPLFNTSSEPFSIKRGQRLVQLVNGDLSSIHFQLTEKLRRTTRGTGGFGSTGA